MAQTKPNYNVIGRDATYKRRASTRLVLFNRGIPAINKFKVRVAADE